MHIYATLGILNFVFPMFNQKRLIPNFFSAIETCKQQLSGEYNLQGQLSECSEQTSSVVPVLEEFIPIKRASFDSDGEEQESNKFKIETNLCNKDGEDSNGKKSEWLRSVQLWNQTPDPEVYKH